MKKVLFIAPDFFGYYKSIKEEMEGNGYEVDWYNDHTTNYSYIKSKFFKNASINKQFDLIVKNIYKKEYDIVFMIFCSKFTKDMILEIKRIQKNSVFVYYTWDSVSSYPNILEWYSLFDYYYSFDHDDCEKYGFKFRPLFYTSSFEKKDKIYDWASIMTIQPSKFEKYLKITSMLPERLHSFQHLFYPSKFLFKIHSFKNKVQINDNILKNVKYNKLSYNDCIRIFRESKCILDCPYKTQKGLTMRTFEVLSQKTKLITTNVEIKKYDFYSPNNIFVVEDNTSIPLSFFDSDFDEDFMISEKYTLKFFVKDVLDFD